MGRVQHRFTERCASIRNIHYPDPRPGYTDETSVPEERRKALKGEPSQARSPGQFINFELDDTKA